MTRNAGLILGLAGIGFLALQLMYGAGLYRWDFLDWDLLGWGLRSEIIRNGPDAGKLVALVASLVGFFFYLRR